MIMGFGNIEKKQRALISRIASDLYSGKAQPFRRDNFDPSAECLLAEELRGVQAVAEG